VVRVGFRKENVFLKPIGGGGNAGEIWISGTRKNLDWESRRGKGPLDSITGKKKKKGGT